MRILPPTYKISIEYNHDSGLHPVSVFVTRGGRNGQEHQLDEYHGSKLRSLLLQAMKFILSSEES